MGHASSPPARSTPEGNGAQGAGRGARLLALCLYFALTGALAARELHGAEELRWRLPQGLRLQGTLRMTGTAWREGKLKFEVSSTLDYAFTVMNQAPDGSAVISCRIERLVFSDTRRGLTPLDYDLLEAVGADEGIVPAPLPTSALLVGHEVTFQFSPQGEVKDVQLPQSVVQAASRVKSLSFLERADFKKLLGCALAGFPRLPVTALREGESWEDNELIPDEHLARGFPRRTTFTFLGRARSEEGEPQADLRALEFVGQAPDVQESDRAAPDSARLLELSGKAHFDATNERFTWLLQKATYEVTSGKEKRLHECVYINKLAAASDEKAASDERATAESDDPESQAEILCQRGNALQERGYREAGVRELRKAALIVRSLLLTHDDRRLEELLAWLLESQHYMPMAQGENFVADELVTLLRRFAAEDQGPTLQERLASALACRAWHLRGKGEGGDLQAERDLTEAIEIYGRLVRAVDRDDLHQQLAAHLASRASLRDRQERHSDAALDLERAVASYRRLVFQKGRLDLERELARSLKARGDSLRRCDELDEAEACLNETIDIYSRLEEIEVHDYPWGSHISASTSEMSAQALTQRAWILVHQKRTADARKDLEFALETLQYLGAGAEGTFHGNLLTYALDLRNYLDKYYPAIAAEKPPDPTKPATFWIAQLLSGDVDARLRAVSALRARATEPSVLGLALALKDESLGVRRRAAVALDDIGPPARSAAPALVEALKDRELRENASHALARIGRGAVPVLVEALARGETEVRSGAAWALWQMGAKAEPAVPALIDALRDREAKVRRAAAIALGRAGTNDEAAAALLAGAMGDGDDEVREACLLALGEMGAAARAALPEIRKLLNAAQPEIRTAASTAWSQIEATAQPGS